MQKSRVAGLSKSFFHSKLAEQGRAEKHASSEQSKKDRANYLVTRSHYRKATGHKKMPKHQDLLRSNKRILTAVFGIAA